MSTTKNRPSIRKTALAIAAGIVVGVVPAQQALGATCTWNPASGNWSVGANWSCGFVPSGGPDAAIIAGGKAVTINDLGRSILTLTNGGTINIDQFGLALASGGSTNNTGGVINIANGAWLNQLGQAITGGTINTTGTGAVVAFNSSNNFLSGVALNGTMDLTSVANSRQRIINGATINGAVNVANGGILSLDSALGSANQTLSGNATVNLNDAAARLALEGTGITTLGANVVVRGQGSIGQALNVGGTNKLVNQGLISADVGGGTLNITPGGGSGGVVNQGTLRASNGATLMLSTGIDNSAGQIQAQNGSAVRQSGVTISGGTIATSGTGAFQATSSASNFLDAVNLNGTLDLTTIVNSRERIINGATINGAANVGNGGILSLDSAFTTGGAQTLGGTAVVNLNDAAARLSIEGNGSTTLGSGITVRGQGNIGVASHVGGSNVLTNNGLISADVGGGTLNITPPAGSGSFINNGTLQAISGGTLLLSTNILANAGSQIVAGAGSAVVQNGVRINGVFSSSGGGNFAATSSSANFLDGVNFTGTLDLSSIVNSRERIINGATINGAVNIANGGILGLDSSAGAANQTLGGTAVINLNDAAALLSINGTGSTTLGSGVTVRGQGSMGVGAFVGGTNLLTNNGLISADVVGGTLNITPPAGSGSFVNNGTLQAINGARLLLSTNVTANPGGQIIAGAGSSVVQNAVTVNGVVNASGSGVFTAVSSAANFLDGVNFTGTLDLSSIANSRERIINGATINGAVNIANGGILGLDSSAGAANQTLGGTAVINLNDAAALLSINGPGSTTLGSGVTVRGQGSIGVAAFVGGANLLTNNGLISADVAGGTLNLAPPANSGSLVNNSTLQAINGGTLLLSTNINNAAGLITAQSGSKVVHNGITITGGTLASSGTGSFQANSSSGNFLSGVTLTGTLDLTSNANSRERIINGATMNGVVNVANGGILSLDSNGTSGGAQTIAGTGVINLNDAGARLAIDGNGSTTLGAGITVRGQGNIGTAAFLGGTNTLFNNGTILADGGTLSITNPAGSGSLAGTGTLQTSGGTLNLATTSGSTQGRLVMGGAGSALNLNTHNLTITNDYTNAQWGSGNSFNERTGISGTGQILAGGNAAQAITGAGITNGNSLLNATLTINNVRVGATTYDYQIANTGSTGPSLRGAIQTNVNGANLTDSRLSGTGVTASNYNTGAPGSNTGNLGVTFTAASAGALAPLTGQVLNLATSFDNIPNQKLNIVLGGGAAAFNAAVGNATPDPVIVANQRIGGGNTAAVTVANTAAAGSFSEDLLASIGGSSGAASGSGSIAGRLAGTNNTGTGAISVAVNTASAGAKTGTVTLNYQTAGAVNGVSNGLGVASVGSQTLTVNGNVYRLASANTLGAISFGNVHVGDTVQQALNISNTAVNDGYSEKLNASFGASSDIRITTSGSINQLAAGSTNNSSMIVGLNTAAAGSVNGTQVINFASDGAGTSGLGTYGLASQIIGVSGDITTNGNVYRLASASPATPNPVNFGNLRIGSAADQVLSISNTAINDGFSEKLNASITSNGAPVTASGAFNLLAAQSTDNSSLHVGIDTSSAGAKGGSATIALVSDGTGTSGLGTTSLPSQTVNVSGNVYRLANAQNVTPSLALAARVGDAAPSGNVSITNQSPDAFTEALKVQAGAAPSGFAVGANPANIAAQGTGTVQVSLNTGTAGISTGDLTLDHISTGAGTTNAADIGVGSSIVALTGKVYAAAVGAVQSAVNFGIVHVGDLVAAKGVSVQNSAPVAALNDTLRASIGGATGPFTSNGATVSGLAPGDPANTTALTVDMNTATAGIYGGTALVGLTSQNPDMADLVLSSQSVALDGTVNNYANALFHEVSGAGNISRSGNQFILDFGTILLGSGSLGAILDINNAVAGPADLLNGSLALLDGDDFASTLLLAGFSGVAAGDSSGDALSFVFDASTLGAFQDEVSLSWYGDNATGYRDANNTLYTLLVRGNVIQGGGTVPEPGTLALLLIAAVGALPAVRRRTMAH